MHYMALRIVAESYHGTGGRRPMLDEEARRFQEAAEQALGKMRAYPIGMELQREINSARFNLSVVKAGEGQGNACVMLRESPEDMKNACYSEVLTAKLISGKIQELLDTKTSGLTPDHPAVKKFNKFYVSGTNDQYMEKLGDGNTYPMAHKSLDPDRKAAHTTEAVLRDRVKFGSGSRTQAAGYVRSLQRGLIGYHIMSWLTPGTGTEAFVVWDPEISDVGADLNASERAAWMTLPNWTALAHELIHGWRLVTGQCVFHPEPLIEAYYEEAMTVGLPPYEGCKFTENKFRISGGEPPRTFYGQKTRIISETAGKKYKTKDESVWAPGESNPPYQRLLQGSFTYRDQSEEKFRRELEFVALEAAHKSKRKDLRVFIFGPIEQLSEIIKWTESTIVALNRMGYQFRIRRSFFNAGTQQLRFYDHLRSE